MKKFESHYPMSDKAIYSEDLVLVCYWYKIKLSPQGGQIVFVSTKLLYISKGRNDTGVLVFRSTSLLPKEELLSLKALLQRKAYFQQHFSTTRWKQIIVSQEALVHCQRKTLYFHVQGRFSIAKGRNNSFIYRNICPLPKFSWGSGLE